METFNANKRQGQQGMTMIELVISIMIISVALVATVNGMMPALSHNADPLWRDKSIKLAQLYIDEVLSKKYDETSSTGGSDSLSASSFINNPNCATLGPDAGENRNEYDDVDDYHGLSDTPPRLQSGISLSNYVGYSAAITVSCDGNTVASSGGTANDHAKKITVVISSPSNQSMTFAVYRGNF